MTKIQVEKYQKKRNGIWKKKPTRNECMWYCSKFSTLGKLSWKTLKNYLLFLKKRHIWFQEQETYLKKIIKKKNRGFNTLKSKEFDDESDKIYITCYQWRVGITF